MKPALRFDSRAEVAVWADAHRVGYALALAATAAYDRITDRGALPAWLPRALAQITLGVIATRDGAARAVAQAVAEPVSAAAVEALVVEAERVATGLAEEASGAGEPAAPELAALWAMLATARALIRPAAVPRARAWRAAQRWSFDRATATIRWIERERAVAPVGGWQLTEMGAELTISGGEAQLTCTCTAPNGACIHGLALLDATRDLLADPARAAEARLLADELAKPSWARAIDALTAISAEAPAAANRIEVWWHIEDELRDLTLVPVIKRPLKRGGWSVGSRISPARLLSEHGSELGERDQRIASELVGWEHAPGRRAAYAVGAFAAAIGHPRIAAHDHGDEPVELVRVALGFTAVPVGDELRLQPAIGGAPLSGRLLFALFQRWPRGEPLVTVLPDRARALMIDVTPAARAVWDALARHGDTFPPAAHRALLDQLGALHARIPIAVPESVLGRAVTAALTTVLRVRLLPDVTLELELFVRPAPGAPLFPPGVGPRDVLLARDGVRTYVRRDLGSELARARAQLQRLPLATAEEGPPGCFRVGGPGLTDEALAVVAAFAQLAPDDPELAAEWIDARPTIGPVIEPAAVRVHVARQRDWFGLAGDVKVDAGRIELAVVLDAARRQQRFVRVGEDRWVELAQILRDRLVAIADHAYSRRDRVELSPGAVPAVGALADAGATVDAAPEWAALTAALASSRALTPKPPAALVPVLRDYQRAGHAWLTRLAAWGTGAVLADDMGLGKTIQAIAVLLDRAKLGPTLVVAPTSVAHNWIAELARFGPTLRPVLYGDAEDRAHVLARAGKRDVVIVSYGLLVRDAALLAGTRFATLVLDEAQALKNAATKRARAARALDAGFRIALSGTPFENHLGELWSLFSIVFPHLFGSWDQFRERYAFPIERAHDERARAALSRVLQPFLLRRTKHEVARELPARTEVAVPIELSADEQALYDTARLAAVASLTGAKVARDAQQRFAVLAALTRLRLLASHPRLYDATSQVASSKLARLLELVDELRDAGHRALIFSQFTSHLAIVRTALDHAGVTSLYLDGGTPAAQRAKLIAQFSAGTGDVFLISLTAGGTGINLTAADYVIHLDPWWNPAVEDQASDRAHRIGQTKPVTIYRLIARGTIEDQIVRLHASKRALVAGVLDGTHVAGTLQTKELLALITS